MVRTKAVEARVGSGPTSVLSGSNEVPKGAPCSHGNQVKDRFII